MRRAARVDDNQPEIVEALRRFGAAVLVTSQLKSAMDLLVGYNGNTYIVEVKDGDKPPSQRKLTKGELKCKAMFEAVGVTYHVIKSVDEAIELINQ
jgi:threonine dehydrogenase-like Zn-dependent dehydrogenase